MRIVGTSSLPGLNMGAPAGQGDYTFTPEDGCAPGVKEAYMEHNGGNGTSYGIQQQHVVGTLAIDSADDLDCQGSLDIDVLGALPPADTDVVIDAHVTGTFAVTPPGR
jgi:hypothetical protein